MCCVLIIFILLLWTNKLDWMRSSQVFTIQADGSLTQTSTTSWNDTITEPSMTCPDADQVYLEKYKSCLRVCRPDQEYDIYTNTCKCPSNSTRAPNGSCIPTCDPTSALFEPYSLKYTDTETNTCRYAYEQNRGTYMLPKANFSIEPEYYTELGEGGETDCASDPHCDAILDGGRMVSFQPDMYGKIGWLRALGSTTEFKIVQP